jgi:carboxypeptidase C (cathepsin A)
MVEYFSLPAVQAALHVEANFFQTDNAEGAFRYTATEPDLRPFYLDAVTNSRLRVLVYNGDADPSINSFMARDWTSHLPGLVETQEWRPWTVDGCRRMGGYVTRYEGDFDFLTIRGAGHMCVFHNVLVSADDHHLAQTTDGPFVQLTHFSFNGSGSPQLNPKRRWPLCLHGSTMRTTPSTLALALSQLHKRRIESAAT